MEFNMDPTTNFTPRVHTEISKTDSKKLTSKETLKPAVSEALKQTTYTPPSPPLTDRQVSRSADPNPSISHTVKPLLTPNAEAMDDSESMMIKKLDQYLQKAVELEHFSGVAMVVHHGKILLNQGYGPATVDDKNDSKTVIHVASITKQFTAAAIMKLWEENKIDLNAPINQYLPKEYQSDKWEHVTVHHLLSHTGGIVDYDERYYDAEKKGFCFKENIKEMIQECRGKELEFKNGPGSEWHYCNIGFTLLGAILENQTHRPYKEIIQKTLLERVGMSSSGIHEEDYVAKKGDATGHRWDEKEKKLVDDDEKSLPVTPPDGGMFTTSGDLLKWSDVLTGKRPDILSPESLKRMTTPTPNTFTPDGGYGYGLFIDDSSGTKRIHHPGWIVGFRSHFCLYPEKEIYISVFCNNTTTNPMKITSELSEIMGEKGGPY